MERLQHQIDEANKLLGPQGVNFLRTRYDVLSPLPPEPTHIPDGSTGKRSLSVLSETNTISMGGDDRFSVYNNPILFDADLTNYTATRLNNKIFRVTGTGTGGALKTGFFAIKSSSATQFSGEANANNQTAGDVATLLNHSNTRMRVVGAAAVIMPRDNFTTVSGDCMAGTNEAAPAIATVLNVTAGEPVACHSVGTPFDDSTEFRRQESYEGMAHKGAAGVVPINDFKIHRCVNGHVMIPAGGAALEAYVGNNMNPADNTLALCETSCDQLSVAAYGQSTSAKWKVVTKAVLECWFTDATSDQTYGTVRRQRSPLVMAVAQAIKPMYYTFEADEDSRVGYSNYIMSLIIQAARTLRPTVPKALAFHEPREYSELPTPQQAYTMQTPDKPKSARQGGGGGTARTGLRGGSKSR